MKKRFISSLFMGTLILASMNVFVSCKDYDDDIDDLRSQITTNATSLTQLVTEKENNIRAEIATLSSQLAEVKQAYTAADAALQQAITEANAKITAAQKAADDADKAAQEAKTAAAAAANGAADAKAAAAAAQASADAAAQAAADAKAQAKAALDAVDALKTQVAELAAAKTLLENSIQALAEALEKVKADVKENGNSIAALAVKDQELTDAITAANARIEVALNEAQKAQTKAEELAAQLAAQIEVLKGQVAANGNAITEAQTNIKNLQETVANNLKSVTEALNQVKAELSAQITLIQGDVKELQKANEATKAAIEALQAKVIALELADANILTSLADLQSKMDEADKALLAELNKQVADLLAKINAGDAELKDLINSNQADLLAKLHALDKDLLAKINAGDQTLLDLLNAGDADLLKKIQDGDASLLAGYQNADAELLANINAQIQAVYAKIKETNDGLTTKIENESRTLHDQIDQLTKDITDKLIKQQEQITYIMDVALKEMKEQLSTELKAYLLEEITAALENYMTKDEIVAYVTNAIKEANDAQSQTLMGYTDTKVSELRTELKAFALAEIAKALEAYYTSAQTDVKLTELTEAYKAADEALKTELEGKITGLGNALTALENGKIADLQGKYDDAATAITLLLNYLTGGQNAAAGQAATPLTDAVKAALASLGNKTLTIDEIEAAILSSANFVNAINSHVEDLNAETNTMITSIDLYYNQHVHSWYGEGWNAGDNLEGGYLDHTLRFITVEEVDNKFPADPALVDGEQITFVKGNVRTYSDAVMVRVSPVSADLKKALENGDIRLLTSQGYDAVADGLIEVTDVKRYEEVTDQEITDIRRVRAAANQKSGLWIITFKLAEGADNNGIQQKFMEKAWKNPAQVAALTEQDFINNDDYDGTYAEAILYSVAIRNTTEAGEDRFVVSEYDLNLAQGKAYHAYPFTVGNVRADGVYSQAWADLIHSNNAGATSYGGIRNRYEYCEGHTTIRTDEQGEDVHELSWAFNPEQGQTWTAYANVLPDNWNELNHDQKDEFVAGNVLLENRITNERYTRKFYDNRQSKALLKVAAGDDDIVIRYDNLVYTDLDNDDAYDTRRTYLTPIRAFYVMLDYEFALESRPSEYNAWCTYDYDGTVGYKVYDNGKLVRVEPAKLQLCEGTNEGAIRIKNKNNVIGDIIGFRIFAVNLDGTLIDPDGRAFYVRVVDPADLYTEENAQTFDITVTSPYPTELNPNEAEGKPVTALMTERYNRDVVDVVYTWAAGSDDVLEANNNVFYTPEVGSTKDLGYQYISTPVNGLYYSYFSQNRNLFSFTYQGTDGQFYNDYTWTPDTKVANLKCQIVDPDRLLDEGTYKIQVAVVKKTYENMVYDQTERKWLLSGNLLYVDTLQKVLLTINKHMPTEYAKIEVKPGQDGNLVYNMYPFPSDRTNNWDIRRLDPLSEYYDANAYYGVPYEEYDFADVYKLINPENQFDPNFKFIFADGGIVDVNGDGIFDLKTAVNGQKDKIDATTIESKTRWNWNTGAPYTWNPSNCGYISTFDLAQDNVDASTILWYDLSAIQHGAIDGKQHDVNIAYSYKDISLTKDANGNPIFGDVDVLSPSTFKYTYKNAWTISFSTPKDTLCYAKDGQKLTAGGIKASKSQTLTDLGYMPNANQTIAWLFQNFRLAYVDGSGTWTCAGKADQEYFMFPDTNFDEVIKEAVMNGNDINLQRVVKTADPNFKDKVVEHIVSFKVENLWGQQKTITWKIPMVTPLHERYEYWWNK